MAVVDIGGKAGRKAKHPPHNISGDSGTVPAVAHWGGKAPIMCF